jgi:uncharacterized membrane protein YagU involved in acid resistance
VTLPTTAQRHDFILLKTWLLVGVTDALFASVVSVTVPPLSNPLKVFQGVASVLIGKDAMNGGAATGVFGLMMHFSVALFWSTVFVLAVRNSATLRGMLRTGWGAFAIAAVYGMSIWLIMSLGVIPALVHRPRNITLRWVVQLIGHIPFVAGPMVLVNRTRANHS